MPLEFPVELEIRFVHPWDTFRSEGTPPQQQKSLEREKALKIREMK